MQRIGRGRIGHERRGPDDHARFSRRLRNAPGFRIDVGVTGGEPSGHSNPPKPEDPFEIFEKAAREYAYSRSESALMQIWETLFKLEIKTNEEKDKLSDISQRTGLIETLAGKYSFYRSPEFFDTEEQFNEARTRRDGETDYLIEGYRAGYLLGALLTDGASKPISENEKIVKMAVYTAAHVPALDPKSRPVSYGKLFGMMLRASPETFAAVHNEAINYIAHIKLIGSKAFEIDEAADRRIVRNLIGHMSRNAPYAIQQNYLNIPPNHYGSYCRGEFLRHQDERETYFNGCPIELVRPIKVRRKIDRRPAVT